MLPIENLFYQLQIKLLAAIRPDVLFDRINQLNWYKGALRQWIDDLEIPRTSQVLEIGCATGTLTTYLAESGAKPTGVDLSGKMIEQARLRNTGLDFQVADVLALPFADGQFDIIVAASLINIVPDKIKAVGELFRTCKRGGQISVLVPSKAFNDANFRDLRSSLGLSGFSGAAMHAWHNRAPKMDVEILASLLTEAGLTEISTKKYLQGMAVAVSAAKPR